MTAISEANSFQFNDPFGLPGNFFCYYLTGGYRTLLDIPVYILYRRKVALCDFAA